MTTTQTFDHALAQRAQAIEVALDYLLPKSTAYPFVIHEAMRYSALGGGKRLRGILLMEAALLAGATDTFRPGSPSDSVTITSDAMERIGAVRAAAAAVEMIHAYSLIHDDLPCMDDDDMRRGKPTNHRVYGEGIAVLAGDALLTRAFEVLGRLAWGGVSERVIVALVAELATAGGTGGLIGGQVADLQSEQSEGVHRSGTDSLEDLLGFIHSHKTGALFKAALRMGGLIAEAKDDELRCLEDYAEHFGLAFQIVDDLLDVEGDTDALGKQVGSDERKGKLTFPVVYGVERARELAKERIRLAKQSLAPFGERATFLCNLADFVLRRDY